MNPLTLKILGAALGVGAVAAALWFAYAWAYGRGVRSMEGQLAAAVSSNSANVVTIDSLRKQLDLCTASVAARQSEAQDLADRLTQAEQDRLQQQRQYEARLRELEKSNPTVKKWLQEGIPDALVPALIR